VRGQTQSHLAGIAPSIQHQTAISAVWQWSVPVNGKLDNHPDARAYLWIPPDCNMIRGVVVAQHNMEEVSILENPVFRKKMSSMGFAEIWVTPSFDHLFRFNEGAGRIFDQMIHALTEESGYTSLLFAPVVPLGHSAAASWPYYFAVSKPERTLAAISVSGQWPYFRSPVFAPDIWSKSQSLDYIPALETMGEYENGDNWAEEGLKERAGHPDIPLSMLTCPAEGHFASTDKKAAYLALYIRKAAEYRYPDVYPETGYPVLKAVDPKTSGWLVPRWRRNEPPQQAAAPVKEYKGNPKEAFWFFDEEMALATLAYQSAGRGKAPQSLAYIQQGKVVAQRETHQQVDLAFHPDLDGIHFSLKAIFSDTVPGGSHFPAVWAQAPAGSSVGHSDNSQDIRIERICGPFVQEKDGNFKVWFSREIPSTASSEKPYELWFIASHPGDMKYKPAILQAVMHIPSRNTQGRAQKIEFTPIKNQFLGAVSVSIHATSDAGLPVHCYVREGPAYIKDSTLIFTEIPTRAKFPLKVTVVAWQYGKNSGEKVQSAESIVRTFYIKEKFPGRVQNEFLK